MTAGRAIARQRITNLYTRLRLNFEVAAIPASALPIPVTFTISRHVAAAHRMRLPC